MRSETKPKFGVKPLNSTGLAKKRGRPAKVKPSVLAEMKTNNDPDIRFLRDLSVTDRTEILAGADPDFRYRWVEETRIGERKMQGYTEADDPSIVTHHDSNFWRAEGNDRKHQNKGGLKLMKIPVSLAKKRDAFKQEKANQQSAQAEAALTSEMRRHGGEVMSDAMTSEVMQGD